MPRSCPSGKTLQIVNDITSKVRQYPRFTIFDDVNVRVENGVAVLTGAVTMGFKREDIGKLVSTNAVYGFVTMLRKLLAEHEPAFIGAAFDLPKPTFRSQLSADYKSKPDTDAARPRRAGRARS